MTDSAPSTAKRLEGESESDWQTRVKRIRREVVMETLESLGFDTDDVNEIQKDILFLRKLRTATERNTAKITAGVIGLVFTLIGAGVTLALQHWFRVS